MKGVNELMVNGLILDSSLRWNDGKRWNDGGTEQ